MQRSGFKACPTCQGRGWVSQIAAPAPSAPAPKYRTVKIDDCELVEFDGDQPDGEFYLVPVANGAPSAPADQPCPDKQGQQGEKRPLNGIAATDHHGEGAIARCSYCGRYSLDRKTLGEDRYQPVCECGEKHGWSGSFVKPGPDARWSGASPAPTEEPRTDGGEGGSCTYPDCSCVPNGDVGCNSPNAAARGLSEGSQE